MANTSDCLQHSSTASVQMRSDSLFLFDSVISMIKTKDIKLKIAFLQIVQYVL